MLIQNYTLQSILYIALMHHTKPIVWAPLLILATGDSQHRMLNQRRSSSVNSATCHAYVSLQNEILNQEWRSDTIMDKKAYRGGRYGDNKYRDASHNRVWVALLMNGRYTAQNAEQRLSNTVNLDICLTCVSLPKEILKQERKSDMIMDKKIDSGGRYGDHKYTDCATAHTTHSILPRVNFPSWFKQWGSR